MRNHGSFTVLSGIAAALVALAGISAAASPLQAEEDADLKRIACSYIGCPGTSSQCADVTGTVTIPGVGEVSVTYYCKEGNAT